MTQRHSPQTHELSDISEHAKIVAITTAKWLCHRRFPGIPEFPSCCSPVLASAEAPGKQPRSRQHWLMPNRRQHQQCHLRPESPAVEGPFEKAWFFGGMPGQEQSVFESFGLLVTSEDVLPTSDPHTQRQQILSCYAVV